MPESFCTWVDPVEAGTQLEFRTIGGAGIRWPHTTLSWQTDDIPEPKGMSAVTFELELAQAFLMVQNASRLTFVKAAAGDRPDILVSLGDRALDPEFDDEGRRLGSALPPVDGRIQFNIATTWHPVALVGAAGQALLPVALHEICHAVGLGHSDDPNTLMYPFDTGLAWLDAETIERLQQMYNWSRARATAMRTSDGPALVTVPWNTLTDAGFHQLMFYRGPGDDARILETELDNADSWGAAVPSGDLQSSNAPSVAARHPQPTGVGTVVLAAKGPGTNKNVHVATRESGDWQVDRFDDSGTVARPAAAWFEGNEWLLWRGTGDDQTLYWSTKVLGKWKEQNRIVSSASTHAPCLVEFQNRLYAFWKGAEGDSTMWFTSRRSGSSYWEPQRQVRYEIIATDVATWGVPGTSNGPGAVVRPDPTGGSLWLVWKGAQGDPRIYLSVFNGEKFSGQMPLADFVTSASPSIGFQRGRIVLAWKDAYSDFIAWATL